MASGLKQQAQLAKANANLVQDPQARRALLEYADALEKSVPLIQVYIDLLVFIKITTNLH